MTLRYTYFVAEREPEKILYAIFAVILAALHLWKLKFSKWSKSNCRTAANSIWTVLTQESTWMIVSVQLQCPRTLTQNRSKFSWKSFEALICTKFIISADETMTFYQFVSFYGIFRFQKGRNLFLMSHQQTPSISLFKVWICIAKHSDRNRSNYGI